MLRLGEGIAAAMRGKAAARRALPPVFAKTVQTRREN